MELEDLYKYFIFLPVIVSLWRFRRITPVFLPVVLLFWLGLTNDLLFDFFVRKFHNNILAFNIYLLLEYLLLVWQLQNWRFFRRRQVFYGTLAAGILLWLADNYLISRSESFNSYFIIGSSYALVLMNVLLINRLILNEQVILWKNPVFLFAAGFVLYFTYSMLVEVFWIYGFSKSTEFTIRLNDIVDWINIVTKIIFSIAFLWVPTRSTFILPSSYPASSWGR